MVIDGDSEIELVMDVDSTTSVFDADRVTDAERVSLGLMELVESGDSVTTSTETVTEGNSSTTDGDSVME